MDVIGNRGAPRHLSKPIPERIKEAREARGFTLESFAIALGKTRQAVAQFETGQTSPSGETLSSIVALTQQPLTFFVSMPKPCTISCWVWLKCFGAFVSAETPPDCSICGELCRSQCGWLVFGSKIRWGLPQASIKMACSCLELKALDSVLLKSARLPRDHKSETHGRD